jgi:hypothetical protein
VQQHPTQTAALIEQIVRREFNPPRRVREDGSPRSEPYVEGFRNGLRLQLDAHFLPMPYRAGTAEADAYLAGKAEGRAFKCPIPLEIHETASAQASA